MKTLLKLFLVLTLCLAVLGQSQNEFSLQADSISLSVSDNLVPFFKVMQNDTVYYLRLQSIYEIKQQNDSQWYRIPGTETLFSSLNWNISTSLSDGTFTLFGSPCPCQDIPPLQEPVLGKRIINGSGRRNIRDMSGDCKTTTPGDGTTTPGGIGTDDNSTNTDNNGINSNTNPCPDVRFEFIKLFFQIDKNCSSSSNNGGSGGNGTNGGNGTSIDADACNSTCVTACANATNATNCIAFCNSFYNVTYIDANICNSTCLVNETVNGDCLAACNSWATCFSNGSSSNVTVDADACNTTCNSACANATNATNCIAFCNSFYNVTYIDANICNSTCLVNETADADCLVACNSWATCFSNGSSNPSTPDESSACTLTLNYHLHNYKWSNFSSANTTGGADFQGVDTNGTRLAFAFEVVPEADSVPCRTFFDNWYEGPWNIQLNVSTLALDNYPDDDSNLDISNATQVESNLVYAIRDGLILGRIYVESFPSGNSIFNPMQNMVSAQPNTTDNTTAPSSRGAPEPYTFPLF